MVEEMQPDELREVLRANVKLRRRELGVSQSEIARRADVAQAYIAQIEAGVRLPTLDILARLAAALNTTPAALLTAEIFSPAVVDTP